MNQTSSNDEQLLGHEIKDGEFQRTTSQFRRWVVPAREAGGDDGAVPAEAGRYHLYISYACPWAHRALIYRKLKGLESLISLSSVHWFLGQDDWTFEPGEGVIADIHGAKNMYEVYQRAKPGCTDVVTVPVLWDKLEDTIVNNESSEIIRMFNSAFNELTGNNLDFYAESHRHEIDAINTRVYDTLNNGVYRSGFAQTQQAYEKAVVPLFATLDWLEDILSKQRYLLGDFLSEADWRLFPTLLRFDLVYYSHFKCNLRRIIDYPNLWAYTRDLYQHPGISETINFDHIKKHYYGSHLSVNPTGIVPMGPVIDFEAPHGRG